MLATKNRGGVTVGLFTVCLMLLAGCAPPGARALREGRKLLEAGRYPEAVEQLTRATALLETNAPAWNYLGLACHHAGDATRAAEAYRRALVLDRDLFEAHFNLGCLWLDQGKADAARSEFTACTLRRADSFEAWLKLGVAQYRLGDPAAATDSFQKVLRFSPNQPEALNGLGLASVQRKRPRDAIQYFNAALKHQPDYRPALLNLATVLRRDLGDSAGAALKYREYLAQDPNGADAAAVNSILQSLVQKPAPVVISPAAAPVTNSISTNTAKPLVTVQIAPAAAKSNPSPPVVHSPFATVASNAVPVPVPSEPLIRTAPAPAATAPPVVSAPAIAATTTTQQTNPPPATEKRSFLSRLNPFRNNPAPPATVVVRPTSQEAELPKPTTEETSQTFPRYQYRSPAAPAAGNRAAAEAALERGRQAEQGGKLPQAVQAYQQAVAADGAWFEAQYQLGLAQYALRDYPGSLGTWENTLAIRPDSTEARYNFALTLKSAGYALAAAGELQKILTAHPNEVRAHLVLGNLCAEQLRDKARARVHYQRILELDSRHPQATAIRYWLVANPG